MDDHRAVLAAICERHYAHALAVASRLCRGGDWHQDTAHVGLERLMTEVRYPPVSWAGQRALVEQYVTWAHVTAQQRRTAARRDVRATVHFSHLADRVRAATRAPDARTDTDEAVLAAGFPVFRVAGPEQALLGREEMAALRAALAALTDAERRSLAQTNKATTRARARLAEHLAEAGYPHVASRGARLPRNRSVQMRAYRERLKAEAALREAA